MSHHHPQDSHMNTDSPSSESALHGDHAAAGHSMFFVLSSEVTLWFESWTISSVGGLIGICIGIFFAAALYEGLKWFREYLLIKAIIGVKRRTAAKSHIRRTTNNGNLSNGNMSNGGIAMTSFNEDNDQVEDDQTKPTLMRLPLIDHMLQTLMHMLQVFVSYLLMLAFMTYNVWIGIAVVLGAGIGYFVFASRMPGLQSVSRMSEHCH